MQKDNNVLKWIIIIVLVIVLSYVSGLVSEMLDINTRSARYLVLIILFLDGISLILYEIGKIDRVNIAMELDFYRKGNR